MGNWDNKASVNEILIFCETGKTREQIAEQFNLTPAESWSAAKYLSKIPSDIIVQKKYGQTHRAHLFITRACFFKELNKE
jgi:hypothetical protein